MWAIRALPLFGDRKPLSCYQSEFNEANAAISPDGHWVAYESDEPGAFEVYLAPFPGEGSKFQVSQGGGIQPAWGKDGVSLFYLAAPKVMEFSLSFKGSAAEIGTPHQLFGVPATQQNGAYGHLQDSLSGICFVSLRISSNIVV